MHRFAGFAVLLAVAAAPQEPPGAGPLEIRVYVLDDQKKPVDVKGWQAFLEIGDQLDGTERELVPMQWTAPRGEEEIEGRHEWQMRSIDGGTWTAEMVVVKPVTPVPFGADHGHAGPYFKAEYSPGDRIKPEWSASVRFLVKGELRSARNFRYPFVEVARSRLPQY